MLSIVATPIGNLQDITLRAIEVLKSADKIYCEDTRVSRVLLNKYEITSPIESFHHHSSDQKIAQIINELKDGQDVAYVTDAGTPGVSDPVGKLVEAVAAAGLEASPIPGASAVSAILSVSGIDTTRYQFWGFVPTKKGRQTFIKNIIASEIPVVVFETAPRIEKFLNQIIEFGGADRRLILGRELTKKFEQIVRGQPAEILSKLTERRGEFVVVINGK